MRPLAVVLAILFGLVALPAAAQTAPASAASPAPAQPSSSAARVTRVEIDEDVIEASPLGPKDTIVNTHKQHAFRSLIHVRQSFAPELLASAGQLF